MAARLVTEVVEGNDVWLVWRVTLPNGDNLVSGKMATGDNMKVSLIHESSLGNSKEAIELYNGAHNATNGDHQVFSSLQTHLWGGLDELGYTVEARIPSSGVDYVLEGGNQYAVEVALITADWGTIHLAASIQVDYLHSV